MSAKTVKMQCFSVSEYIRNLIYVVLESIEAYFGVSAIGREAFSNCTKLKEAHFCFLKTIRDNAFIEYAILETIELGDSIKQLGKKIFADCNNLRSLEVESNYDKINDETLCGANNLKCLTLYSSTKELYIPPHCFDDTVLEEVTLLGNFDPIIEHHSCFPENVLELKYINILKFESVK